MAGGQPAGGEAATWCRAPATLRRLDIWFAASQPGSDGLGQTEGRVMSGRRVDVSATQVIASMLAAVTGAVAASTLGIAGTVIGAAVMSVASTMVAAIYKHYLGRSHERLRAAAEAAKVSPLVSGGAAAALRSRHRAAQSAQHATQPDATQPDAARLAGQRTVTGPDADQTEVFPAVGYQEHRWHDADRANGFATQIVSAETASGAGADEATHLMAHSDGATAADSASAPGGAGPDEATQMMARPDGATAAGRPPATDGTEAEATPLAGDQPNGDQPNGDQLNGDRTGRQTGATTGDDRADAPASGRAAQPRWRRPLALAGMALAVFLLAMAGITVFEAIAGKPLDAIVGGKHSSGTTVGGLIGGQSTASHHSGPAPAPTPTPSPSSTPSPTPSPTPTATTPSPAPSPTTSPTTGHTAGVSPGPPATINP
jgi:hypothetical protein